MQQCDGQLQLASHCVLMVGVEQQPCCTGGSCMLQQQVSWHVCRCAVLACAPGMMLCDGGVGVPRVFWVRRAGGAVVMVCLGFG